MQGHRGTRTSHRTARALLGVVLSASAAHAADPATDPAHALFREARALAESGKYDAACPKFEKSLALDRGVGTEFNLADCWEHLGKTESARALFANVARETHAAGQTDREEAARTRLSALEPKLSRLTIQVPKAPEGLVVTRDGAPVDAKDLGTPVSVDPGVHEIRATASGVVPWTGRARTYGATSVVIVIPELVPVKHLAESPPRRLVPTKATTSATPPPVTREAAPDGASERNRRTLQLVSLAAAGLGAVITGTSLAVFTSTNNDAKGICPQGSICTPGDVSRHSELIDDAKLARTFTYVGLGVTVTALAGFAVVTFVPFENRDRGVRTAVSAGVGPEGSLGGTIAGTF